MNIKKEFQALVAELRKALPREQAPLAECVHRTAGETRRQISKLKQELSQLERHLSSATEAKGKLEQNSKQRESELSCERSRRQAAERSLAKLKQGEKLPQLNVRQFQKCVKAEQDVDQQFVAMLLLEPGDILVMPLLTAEQFVVFELHQCAMPIWSRSQAYAMYIQRLYRLMNMADKLDMEVEMMQFDEDSFKAFLHQTGENENHAPAYMRQLLSEWVEWVRNQTG